MKVNLNIAPYLMWLILFVTVPLLLVLFFAFTGPEGTFTFESIIEAGKYFKIFLRSIGFGLISTLICLVIGYPMAYFLSESNVKRQSVFIILLMIPMWTSFLLRTYAWMTILEYNGLLNRFFESVGIGKFKMINTLGAVILGMVYNFLPFMVLSIYTVLTKIDKKLVEAAQDLGANRLKVFQKVILPLSVPGIISGFTMVFVPAVSTFIISKILGGGSILIIGDLIEMQFLGNSYNPHLGSAISLILMIIIIICTSIMNKFDKVRSEESGMML